MIPENLTLGIILGAALVDSINPCVIGVLVFLLAFMTRVFQSRTRMLLGGLLYSFVVYITYLALGLDVLRVAVSIGFSTAFYWIAAAIAIMAGLLEIKDYFWYGKGFTLQMMPGGAARLKYYTSKIEEFEAQHPKAALLLIAALGIFVVLVELPCTGAPYFAILALLAQGSYTEAVPLLLIYNFVFILPLLAVILIAYFGAASETIEAWRQKHRELMRLIIGTFLIALGVYMVYTLGI